MPESGNCSALIARGTVFFRRVRNLAVVIFWYDRIQTTSQRTSNSLQYGVRAAPRIVVELMRVLTDKDDVEPTRRNPQYLSYFGKYSVVDCSPSIH